MLFRTLTPDEEKEFRQYATDNDPPDLAKWDIYHPICREVWLKRGIAPIHVLRYFHMALLKRSSLYIAYRFFRRHGSSIVGESATCALALARAELWMEDQEELDFIWEYDDQAIDDCAGEHELWCSEARRFEAGYDTDGTELPNYAELSCKHEVLWCALVEWDFSGIEPKDRHHKLTWDNNLSYTTLASLGGIIDPDRDYKRVIEAELALEVLAERQRDAIKAYSGERD